MKVWGRFRNPKLARTATLAFLAFLIFTMIAYATTLWSFNQNLPVPTGSLALYSDSGATIEIGNGSNQSLTELWRWNGINGWNATVFVKNIGTSMLNFTVSIGGYKAGWVAGYAAVGGTSRLFENETRAINLWIYSSPAPVSGESTGSFTVTVSVA
jgi:hypothetical protein